MGCLARTSAAVARRMPPGYSVCRRYSLVASLRPVSRTLAAFTTTTKLPASTCGAKAGFVLPRSTEAMRDASLPSTLPSASATYQQRAARASSALRLLVIRVVDMP